MMDDFWENSCIYFSISSHRKANFGLVVVAVGCWYSNPFLKIKVYIFKRFFFISLTCGWC